MRGLPWAAAVALLLAGAPSRAAAGPACSGTLSGAVSARFDCTVVVAAGDEGRVYLTIAPAGEVEGIPSLAPGSFDVTGVLRLGTWSLSDLGMGKAAVALKAGALYTAARTSSQRGEVTLTFTRVRKAKAGAYDVAGTYRARLLPVGAGKEGEVVVEVTFGAPKR